MLGGITNTIFSRRADVQYDWKTGESLKHAYVIFAKEEEAEAATSAFCGRRRRQGILGSGLVYQ